MNSAQNAVLGAVVGAGLAGAIVWVWLAVEPPVEPLTAPPASVDAVRAAAVPPAPVATATDLSPITDRLDDLSERLRRLETKLDRVQPNQQKLVADIERRLEHL